MTRVAEEVSVNLLDLVDAYVEDPAEFDFAPTLPALYRFDYLGEPWLTDRFWLLPEAATVDASVFTIETLGPQKNVDACCSWIDAIMTRLLLPATAEFAATFAGVLTEAGLTAHSIGLAKHPHALVTESGARIGGLMACREPAPNTTPIPAPERTCKMFHRIDDMGMVRPWQAWEIAVRLGKSERV